MEKIEDILQGYINEAKAGRGLAVTRKDLEDAVRQIRMTRPPRPEPLSAEEREKRRIGFTPMEQMQSVQITALQAEVARLTITQEPLFSQRVLVPKLEVRIAALEAGLREIIGSIDAPTQRAMVRRLLDGRGE